MKAVKFIILFICLLRNITFTGEYESRQIYLMIYSPAMKHVVEWGMGKPSKLFYDLS